MNKTYPFHRQFQVSQSKNDLYCAQARITLSALRKRKTWVQRLLSALGVTR